MYEFLLSQILKKRNYIALLKKKVIYFLGGWGIGVGLPIIEYFFISVEKINLPNRVLTHIPEYTVPVFHMWH